MDVFYRLACDWCPSAFRAIREFSYSHGAASKGRSSLGQRLSIDIRQATECDETLAKTREFDDETRQQRKTGLPAWNAPDFSPGWLDGAEPVNGLWA